MTITKVFDTPFGKIGITICFDAAFSEVRRVLALRGASIIVNIAAVPNESPVRYMWRRFTGAALNNQVVVVYANSPEDTVSGYSAVFDPYGDAINQAKKQPSIFETDINLDAVQKWREEGVIYPYRRPLLYRNISRRTKIDHDLQVI